MAADTGTAVPKFGEWDESNPSSAEGYTGIFDKVREEKQIGVSNLPSTPPPAYNIKKQQTGHNTKVVKVLSRVSFDEETKPRNL